MNTRSNPIVSAIVALIPIAAIFLPVIVVAQQPEVKNPPQQEIPQSFEDFSGNLLEGFYDASLDRLAKPETAEKIATFARNYYEALIKKGFSAQEALYIVTQHGQPLTNQSQ